MYHFSGSYITLFGETCKSIPHDNCDLSRDVSREIYLSFFFFLIQRKDLIFNPDLKCF